GFLLLGKVDDHEARVLRPSSPRPERITRAEFEAIWDGRVVSAGSPGIVQRALHGLAAMGIRARGLALRVRDGLMRPRFADRCNIVIEAGEVADAGSARAADSAPRSL